MFRSQRYCLFFTALHLLFAAPTATAAPTKSTYDWTDFYFGTKAGAVFSQINAHTSTQAGSMFTPEQATVVNNVGEQTLDTTGFLSGVEGGYNWQFNRLLLGLEADLQSLSTNAIKYSDAISYTSQNTAAQYVITSYAENNWLLTARPRLGLIVNNWVLYATGGLSLALLHSDFLFSDSLGSFESQKVSKVKPGYVVGAGVETSLTNTISLKTEYLFADFQHTSASKMDQSIPAGQTFLNGITFKSNSINLGLNYHVDGQLPHPLLTASSFDASHWKTKIGARLFFSSGLVGAPQPLLNTTSMDDILASRLIFSDLSATSEEVFARIDHSSGVFVKGYLGAGSVSHGQLNDEDFPAGGDVYSNTISNAHGNLSYATADIGYAFLRSASATAGAFIGYNYYALNTNTYNCTQLAGASNCAPATVLNDFLALSEDDTFNSLRLGVSSELNLTNHWTLTSEAAYLPVVRFRGLDMHNARTLIGPESSNQGNGTMLETLLNYQLNNAWSMGVGGRYWSWNMHKGTVLFDFLGASDSITEPARFNAERYGAFLQINYHTLQSIELPHESTPVNWKGLFIGGTLGGAWSNSYWSDPFGPTIGDSGLINAASFGDQIRSSGPLAGLDLHVNWQTDRLVYGVGGSISGADIRGENTIFSGIGGINGQEKSNYLGTIVGRIGTTLDRSLLYLNAGGALLNTQYNLIGNTGILELGVGSQTLSTWGWTAGAGIEYALTDSWNTSVEYDYIGIPNHSLSFPSVDLVNEQSISEHRNTSVFKLGIQYKLYAFKS